MLELMLLFGALAVLPMFFDGRDNDGDTETEAPDTGGGDGGGDGGGEDGGEGGGNGGGNGGGGYVEGMDPIYAGDRSFDGTNGNDRIFTDDYYLSDTNGRAWNDSLYGGAGNDRLGAGYGDDLIDGGGGSDQLDGWFGNDTLVGDSGNDLLTGGPGNDVLYGGRGDDMFSANPFDLAGQDTIFGGAGDDLIWETGVVGDSGSNASDIYGGEGDDTLGFDGGSRVTSGAGNDSMAAFIDIGVDDPTVINDFNPAEDNLDIFLTLSNITAPAQLSMVDWADGAGADLRYGDEVLARIGGAQGLGLEAFDIRVSMEQGVLGLNYTDGPGSTVIFGNSYSNVIDGGAGDDVISVGGVINLGFSPVQGGENLVYGGAGDDTISGSGGQVIPPLRDDDNALYPAEQRIDRDALFGGDGDDLLLSSNGNDLTGGAGADVFALQHTTGVRAYGFIMPASVITDFNPAEDRIEIAADTVPSGAALSVAVWANGQGSDILAGDTVVARVTGGQTLSLADIRVVTTLEYVA